MNTFKIAEFLEDYLSGNQIEDVISKYSEPWRHYHNLIHINNLLSEFESLHSCKEINDDELLILQLAAIFHDVIYFPWNVKIKGKYTLGKSNEELSADYFEEAWTGYKAELYYGVHDIILATETHQSDEYLPKLFNQFDMSIMYEKDWSEVLEWENNIRKEYSFASTKDYKEGRLGFLKANQTSENITSLISHVENGTQRVAFYAGSFNPFHIGHLDIVNKAKEMFDKVVILIGQNPFKPPISDFEERKNNIFRKTACEVDIIEGYLADYLKNRAEEQNEEVFLIKGFRNGDDISYELTNDRYSKDIWIGIRTVYLPSEPELTHISSTAVKALEAVEKGSGSQYLPKNLF